VKYTEFAAMKKQNQEANQIISLALFTARIKKILAQFSITQKLSGA
jgi:hypothetical protein